MNLVLKNISLPLAGFTLEVNLKLHGRVTVVFGPSGSGKTSLLEVTAGLRRPASAFIQLEDRVLTDTAAGACLPPRDRGIGYVPQDLALFPHLSVRRNLLYGHRATRRKNPLFSLRHVVDVLEIGRLVDRSVRELSGGEKQRVALARALLTSPALLLLDEPLASLDMKLRARILPYLVRIRDEFQVPMLYVTHDRFEALRMADELVVLASGKVAQTGPAEEVFNRPASLEVAGFLTVETIQPGRILKSEGGLLTVAVGSATLRAVELEGGFQTSEVFVCIRAEDIILAKESETPSSARNRLTATVQSVTPEGLMMRVDLDAGFPLTALLTRQACQQLALAPSTSIVALIKAPHIHLIAR